MIDNYYVAVSEFSFILKQEYYSNGKYFKK